MILTESKKSKKQGFSSLLEEVREQIVASGQTLDAIRAILTQGDRIPLEVGLRCLTFEQRGLYDLLVDECMDPSSKKLVPIGTWVEEREGTVYQLGIRGYGRIIMETLPVLGVNDVLIGEFRIDAADRIALEMRIQEQSLLHKPYDDQAYAYVEGLNQEDLQLLLDQIHFNLNHLAPGLLYVRESTFTHFYEYNNLLPEFGNPGGTYVMEGLRALPVQEWSDHEKLFIYCLSWIVKLGRPIVMEAFNGVQLSPLELEQYLVEKIKDYQLQLGRADEGDQVELTLPDKLELYGRLRSEVEQDYILYRKINGLNLFKTDHPIPRSSLNGHPLVMPEDIRSHLLELYGLDVAGYDSTYSLFYDFILKVKELEGFQPDPVMKLSPVEKLIQVIVGSAVSRIQADVGMSSTLRDIGQIAPILDQELFEEACQWPQNSWFCCTVPSEAFKAAMISRGPLLSSILKAISIRMQYNCWHFLPGNFPPKRVPKDRHFYIPGRMPDIAEWSDQHHKGHMLAGVRYTIRIRHHLTYKSKSMYNFFDLRLMRQRGEPFSEAELAQGLVYTGYLQSLYQAILDLNSSHKSRIQIDAFTKDWYDEHYTTSISTTIPG